ncbi:patatin-like phospholipase family protein [Paraclostridium bifermentans]|nr:patatin-like phospholipase family protein [Paraclostridium bifermentans]
MKANLVCKGGGMKGIALVGAIACLEDSGYEWDRLAGTSAGALVASLLSVGYTSSEIEEILYDIDYPKFKDKIFFNLFPLQEIY